MRIKLSSKKYSIPLDTQDEILINRINSKNLNCSVNDSEHKVKNFDKKRLSFNKKINLEKLKEKNDNTFD